MHQMNRCAKFGLKRPGGSEEDVTSFSIACFPLETNETLRVNLTKISIAFI